MTRIQRNSVFSLVLVNSRRGTAFWSQKYSNYRRLDGKIQDTFLKNTGDLKGDFNDKYNKKKTFFYNWYGL